MGGAGPGRGAPLNATHIAGLVAAAVLVFWAVGAYNRLVRLRSDITRAFAPVDAQIRQRHALLLQWIEDLRALHHEAPPVDSVHAACGQLQAACDALRASPVAARAAVSLRLAEETLAGARSRLTAEQPAKPELLARLGAEVLAEELAAADSTLGFARSQFNQATQAYNAALHQFPTSIIAELFRFSGAGTL